MNFQLPGLNLGVNIKKLDTPEFQLAKRIYDQAVAFGSQPSSGESVTSLATSTTAIGTFISEINAASGLAKPTQFKVEITSPKAMTVERSISTFCSAAQFPSNSVATEQYRIYGAAYDIPYTKLLDTVTFTFHVDSDMKVKRFFDKWMSIVVDDGGSDLNELPTYDISYSDEYVTNIYIHQLSQNYAEDGIVYTLVLFDAYPKSIGSLDLSHSSTNVFHSLPVTFCYRHMATVAVSTNEPMITKHSPLTDLKNLSGMNKLQSMFGGVSNNLKGFIPDFYSDGMNMFKSAVRPVKDKITSFFG